MKDPRKMPKGTSQRTPAPNQTAKRPKNAQEQRKKALALLNEWTEKHVPVELMAGNSGVKIMGYISRLRMDPNHDDFMFKTPFGIVVVVFTLIYDDMHVDELFPGRSAVYLGMSRFPDDRLRIEPQPGYAASTEQVKMAEDVFNSWIKEGSKVIVTMGDDLRVSACICEITKAGESGFMLTDRQAKGIHVVFPEESGIIEIESRENGTEVTLYNRRTNSHISIKNTPKGGVESAEELLARCPMASRFVN